MVANTRHGGTLMVVASCLVMGLGWHVEAAKPVPPAPPPIYYHVTWLGTLGGSRSSATAINNDGVVVGWADDVSETQRAFVCQAGVMIDLNDFGSLGGGWWAWRAADINDSGQIAGTAWNADGSARAFVFDPSRESPLTLLPPTVDGVRRHRAVAINSRGDILGYHSEYNPDGITGHAHIDLYQRDESGQYTAIRFEDHVGEARDMNDSGQLLGSEGLFTPGIGWTRMQPPLIDCGAVSEVGTVVGSVLESYYVRRKLQTEKVVVRLTDPGDPSTFENVFRMGSTYGGPGDINSAGDVSINWVTTDFGYRRPILYHEGTGALELDRLIVGAAEDVADWLDLHNPHAPVAGALSERNQTGFPLICGGRSGATDRAFVLTPIPAG